MDKDINKGFIPETHVPVGGIILRSEPIEYNVGRQTEKITVHNTGDRPIQVGSHFHFFEANRFLEFDRPATFGCHLNIPATSAIRFEPGEEKEVQLVEIGGAKTVFGLNDLTCAEITEESKAAAMETAKAKGFVK